MACCPGSRNRTGGDIAVLIVTTGAVPGCGLIEGNARAVDIPVAGVAKLALYFLVGALEGKVALGLVVEGRRLPMLCIVAKLAALGFPRLDELTRVRILVTGRAMGGGRPERGLGHLALRPRGLVAIVAGYFGVGAEKRKGCFRVVEARQIGPGFYGVAGFAAFRASIRAGLRHLLLELVSVRIGMAPQARTIRESVRHNLRRMFALSCRMAFRARDGEVSAGEGEAALLMLRDREGRGLEPVDRVASLALPVVGRGRKLAAVDILVTVEAFGKRDFVSRFRAGRNVAFCAFHCGMASLQRIGRRGVSFHVEERGLPSVYRVAGRALSLILAGRELAVMRIGCVTIHALRKRQRLLEIVVGMALRALHLGVFSEQRKLCF